MHRYIFILLLCISLVACGPKSVGQGAPQAEITGVGYANDDPSRLRYPLSGKKIDKTLYVLNHPEFMQQWQDTTHNYLRGLQADPKNPPNDYNNLQPRQASPFRQ